MREFDDQDLDFQEVLRASLLGVGPGSAVPAPPRLARSYVPLPPESGSRSGPGTDTPTHTPRYHPYGAPGDPPQPSSSADKVAASMARNRAIMERMLRQQEIAQREVYEDEIARFLHRTHPDTDDEDGEREMEDIEDAIAESQASARVEGHGQPENGEDQVPTATSRHYHLPSRMPLTGLPSSTRVYDDDDESLQRALQASLETVPEDFVIPDVNDRTPPRMPLVDDGTIPALEDVASEKGDEDDVETSSEADASVVSAPSSEAHPEPEQVSVEELRKRRLARFGG